jgi:hypothetical protein
MKTMMREKLSVWQARYDKYRPYWPATFFILGFAFDVFTLDRVDSTWALLQQLLYLSACWLILIFSFFLQTRPDQSAGWGKIRHFYEEYKTEALHFFFGALLSTYTLFFFKSSSLVVSFGFMVVMAVLLVANEWSRFQAASLPFKFALLCLCTLCFSLCVVPIFAGSIGLLVFLASLVFGVTPFAAFSYWLLKRRAPLFELCKKQILIPSSLVTCAFLILYVFHLIPPVPLSVQFMGVYHDIKKNHGVYELYHENPWWRFWSSGDQKFAAQPGDKVYVFFRIFSPTHFSDRVRLVWSHDDPKYGWVKQDEIPIEISGGRDLGFRGYGLKSNYVPGDWRVQLETLDGREVSRIHFNLDLAPEIPRRFEMEVQ